MNIHNSESSRIRNSSHFISVYTFLFFCLPFSISSSPTFFVFAVSSSSLSPLPHRLLFFTVSSSSPSPIVDRLLFLTASSSSPSPLHSPSPFLHQLLSSAISSSPTTPLLHHLFFSTISFPPPSDISYFSIVHNPVSPSLVSVPNSFPTSLAF